MGLLGSDRGYVFIRLSGPRLGRFGVLLLLVGVCVCVLAMYVCPGFGCVLEDGDGLCP